MRILCRKAADTVGLTFDTAANITAQKTPARPACLLSYKTIKPGNAFGFAFPGFFYAFTEKKPAVVSRAVAATIVIPPEKQYWIGGAILWPTRRRTRMGLTPFQNDNAVRCKTSQLNLLIRICCHP